MLQCLFLCLTNSYIIISFSEILSQEIKVYNCKQYKLYTAFNKFTKFDEDEDNEFDMLVHLA